MLTSSKEDEEQLKIDQKILELQDSIRQLQSQRNMLAPISRLPPELILKIFVFVKAASSRQKSFKAITKPILSWVKVSHVCRHWRNVAIDCITLWDEIRIDQSPAWAEEMILRSKEASIDIISNLLRPNLSRLSATRLAFREIYRAKSLTFASHTSDLEPIMDALPTHSPLLEQLILRGIPNPYYQEESSQLLSWPFPDTVSTGCSTPRLRKLQLAHCCIKWDSPLYFGLTELILDHIPQATRPTLSQFLDILENMPGLHYLDLVYSVPKADKRTAETSNHRVVCLPYLSLFSVSSTTIDCARLIECLVFTTKCQFTISCDSQEKDITLLERRILDTLMNSILSEDGEKFQRYRSLSIRMEEVIDLEIRMSPAHWHCVLPEDLHSQVCLVFTGLSNNTTSLLALTKAIRLLDVETLFVNADESFADIGCAIWESLLPRLPNVKHVEVGGKSEYSFIEVLSRDFAATEKRSHHEAKGMYLSLLRSLAISCTNFDRFSVVERPAYALRNLMNFLMLRYEYGAEIHRLKLDVCSGLEMKDVQLLEEIVVNVIWDGIVSHSTGSDDDYDDSDEDDESEFEDELDSEEDSEFYDSG